MAKYHAFCSNTNTASATVPMFNLSGGTAGRVILFHMIIGCAAAPANQAALFALRRTSARGTSSTSFTPTPLDPADAACSAVFHTSWSGNPTITASSDLHEVAMNQQATYQWMVDPSNGIVIPATAAAGLALVSDVTTSAASFTFSNYFVE